MKPLPLAALAAASVCTALAGLDPDRIRDLDPKGHDKLAGPKGNLDMFVAADRVIGLGGDLPNHKGYGATLGLYVLPESFHAGEWRTVWGGELSLFRTTANGTLDGRDTDEELYGCMALGEYGFEYGFTKNWRAGILFGAGMGAFYGAIDDGRATHAKGNWDWVLQAKPNLAYRLESGVWLFLAYRFAYMTPVYDTEMLGRHTTKVAYNALEFGATWRF